MKTEWTRMAAILTAVENNPAKDGRLVDERIETGFF
jgi:hypothetical protein